jgi:hypothetical protein
MLYLVVLLFAGSERWHSRERELEELASEHAKRDLLLSQSTFLRAMFCLWELTAPELGQAYFKYPSDLVGPTTQLKRRISFD